MEASFPHSTFYCDNSTGVRFCELLCWPVPPPVELPLVVADLERGWEIGVTDHGQVAHLAGCTGDHRLKNLALSLAVVPEQWVRLRVEAPDPPAVPGVWLLDPLVSAAATPEFPHRNWDDSGCILYPNDNAWNPHRGDGLLEYLRLAMPWVLKALVWLATRGNRSYGVWLGPDASGDPRDDLDALSPSGPCVCRTGKTFGACHRPQLVAMAMELEARGIPRQLAGTGRYIHGVLAELRARHPIRRR